MRRKSFENSVLFVQFFYKPKTALKIKHINFKKKITIKSTSLD